MVPGKIIVTGMIALALFGGCSKKKSSDREFASSARTASSQTPSASQDIFDEFYKEDTSTSVKSAPVSQTEPPVKSKSGSPSFVENGRYVVQVSTLPSRSLAEATSTKLSAKGYPAYIAEVNNPTPSLSGTYYRVRIGGFSGISSARAFGTDFLVPDGYDFWVDNRSNDNVGIEGSGMGSGGSYYSNEPASESYFQSTTEPAPAQTDPAEQSAAQVHNEPASPPSQAAPPATTSPAPTVEATPAPATTNPAANSIQTDEWGSSSDW